MKAMILSIQLNLNTFFLSRAGSTHLCLLGRVADRSEVDPDSYLDRAVNKPDPDPPNFDVIENSPLTFFLSQYN